MFCVNCGKEVRDGQRFCGRCGAPIKQIAASAVDASAKSVDEEGGQGGVSDGKIAVRDDARGESTSLKTDDTVAIPRDGEKLGSGARGAERDGADETIPIKGSSSSPADMSGNPTVPVYDRSKPSSAARDAAGARAPRPRDGSGTAVMPPVAAGNAGQAASMNPVGPYGAMGPGGQPSPKRNRNKVIAAATAAVAAVVIVVAVLLFASPLAPGEQPTVCTLATLVDPVDASGAELEGYEVTLIDRETGKEVSSLSVPNGGGFSLSQFRDSKGNQVPNGKYMLRFKDLQSGNVYDGRLVDIDNNASNAEERMSGNTRKWTDPAPLPAPEPAPSSGSPETPDPAASSSSPTPTPTPTPAPSPEPPATLPTEMVTIPDVSGKTRAEAQAALQKLGLDLSTDEGVDESVLAGTKPKAGEEVKRGTLLKAEYAVDPQAEITVPDVTGKTCAEAEEILGKVGLAADYRGYGAEDVVIDTAPPAGEKAQPGSAVSITCDTLIATLAVPDVTGKTCAEAEAVMADAGFVLEYDPADVDKRIEATNPPADTIALKGESVYVESVTEGGGDSDDGNGSSNSAGSSNGGNESGEGSAPGASPVDAESAYLAKVKEYQAKYGKGAVEPVGTGNEQLAGLALVDLVDLDGDGAEELVLGYYDKSLETSVGSDGFKDHAAYQLEIWFHNGRDIEKAYQGTMLSTNGGWAFARFFEYDDDRVVLDTARYVTDADGVQSFEGEVLAFEDGKMSPVLTYAAHGVGGMGSTSYEVDGEEVDRTVYEQAVRDLNEDHDSTTYNMMGATADTGASPEGYTIYGPDDVIGITEDCIESLGA